MRANGRKSIFTTGAASGMGRETACLFAQHGWFVGAYDVDTAGGWHRSKLKPASRMASSRVST